MSWARGRAQPVVVGQGRSVALGAGRWLRLRLDAYEPATLRAWLAAGRRATRLGPVVVRRFGGAGGTLTCIALPRRPRGWYAARRFRVVVGLQRGSGAPAGAPMAVHSAAVAIRL